MNNYKQQEELKKDQQVEMLEKMDLILTDPIKLIQMASEQIQPAMIKMHEQIVQLQSENIRLRLENESDVLTKKLGFIQEELIKKEEEVAKAQIEKEDYRMKLEKSVEQLDLANSTTTQLENLNKDLRLQTENQGKDIEALQKEKTELSSRVGAMKGEIEQHVKDKENLEQQIVELNNSRFAIFVKLLEQLEKTISQIKTSVDGKWGEYLENIEFVVSKESDELESVIERLITPERSVLCKLISIRWWAMQPNFRKEMQVRFNVDLVVCLTELLIEEVKQFGYSIVVPNGELYSDIDSKGYSSFGGDFSVVTELFSADVVRFEKKTFSEVAKLSYSHNGRSIVGEMAYSKKQ